MVLAQVVRGDEWYNPDGLKTAAGKEFYFAIFDHWLISDDSNQDFGYFHISSEKSNTVTIQSGDKILDQVNIAPNSIQTIGFYKSQITTNKPIHITSTEPCYVNVWVHSALNNYYSETCTAASAILPVHLLGTNYVLQGIEGASPIDYSHNASAVRIVCTSKFCVVGIAENTTIKVKAANNTKLYQEQSGKSFSEQSFSLSQGEVLYFNLNTLTPDISGTVVSADKPIAVFQGNDLTQLPTEKSPFNGVWEQARPVSSWGTEFIIPKSGLFMKNTVKITASEDNTEVYLVEGTRQRLTTINAGETYERLIISEIPELAVHHLQTTKPVCCYIYSGSERTNGAEGPEMAEIIPMDSAATEARWAIHFTTNDGPYTSRLIITTRTDNMEYVKLNGQKLSIPMYDGRTRYDSDGYSTWEIPIEPASSGKIIADEGSFSAYIVHKSSKNSVALFNIGLPDPTPVDVQITITSPDSVCPNDPYTFTADIPEALYQVNTPLKYRWMYKSPEYPSEWRKVGEGAPEMSISSFQAHHVGWYKLIVNYSSILNDPDNRFESNELFVTFKKCEPDLCIDGNLLYRDDFGGNSPSDPRVRTTPVPGMSYQQLKTDRFGSMGQGKYLVTKMGYCNGDTAALRRQYGYLPNWGSQWMLQDDHTYMSDYSRGYFVEIDGKGDNSVFYSTTINNLCQGAQLTFSAYVINVHFYEQVQKFFRVGGYDYAYPRMKFVLKNPKTGATLAEQSTGDIQPDVTKSWNIHLLESAEWQLVGMKFTVPPGVESIQMLIYNDAKGGTGNDFALDDIEIHICVPPVTVSGPDSVCASWPVLLESQFVNDGTYLEPLQYQWYFSADSTTWTPINGAKSPTLRLPRMSASQQGWYRILVGGADESTCGAMSMPHKIVCVYDGCTLPLCEEGTLLFKEDFGGNDPNDPEVSTTPVPGMSYTQLKSNAYGGMAQGKYLVTKKGYRNSSASNYSVWHIMDDHTYFGNYSRGYFMEIDGKGDNSVFYSTSLNGLCAGSKLSLSAWVANLTPAAQYNVWRYDRDYVHPKLTFIITDPNSGEVLARYNTDTIAHDWTLFGVSNAWQQSAHWQQVGMSFIVPEGVSSVRLAIQNNVSSSAAGNDFALDDIEVRLCAPPVQINALDTVCRDTRNILSALFENDGTFVEPVQYQWYFSADSSTWEVVPYGNSKDLKLKAKPQHSGWYRVAVSGSGNIESANCRAISEPHKFYVIPDCPPILCADGILLFREDFGGNDPNDPRISTTPVPGMTYNQLTDDRFGSMRSGSYLVTKQGYCNGDTSITNLPQNRGSQWHLQDDHTYPDDNTRGYFMEVDGKGDNAAFYTTTIDGLCAGTDLSFIAYVANVVTWGQYTGRPGYFAYPRLLFRLTDPDNGQELAAYDTGEIPFDSTFMGDYKCWQYSSKWHQVGMNFTVPENISSVKLTIYNNSQGTIGNDFAIDDIEIRLCLDPVYVSGTSPACRKKQQTLWATYDNWGTILSPEYQWYYANDSIGPYAAIEGETKNYYRIPIVHKSHEGWYRVAVAEEGHTADEHCRSMSEPFHLETKYCDTYTEQQIDTTACDTLLAESYTWRGHIWNSVGTLTDTIKDFEDDDSVYVHLYMHDIQCCPDLQTIYVDSAVCDTLLPFLWMYRDTMLLFETIGVQEFIRPHAKWINCDGTNYVLRLDTFHCERLYPIIVNKYNWQLVCDNVALRRFFPDNKALAFQWYKNGEPIPGANEDDYAEQNELNGIFQLQIRLDAPVDNDDEYIWSNILEIGEVQAPEPIVKKVYHWWSLTIIRYQQGDRVWYEKKLR